VTDYEQFKAMLDKAGIYYRVCGVVGYQVFGKDFIADFTLAGDLIRLAGRI